jgi:hypothetical protein
MAEEQAGAPDEPGMALSPFEKWMTQQENVLIDTLEDGRRMIRLSKELAQRTIMLTPLSTVVQVDKNWSPIPRSLQLEPNVDTYKVGYAGGKDQHALKATALMKIAEMFQIEAVKTDVVRFDGGMEVYVTAVMRGPDGIPRRARKSRDIVWADHEEQLVLEATEKAQREHKAIPTDAALRKLVLADKTFALAKLETKAFCRCVRALLGIATLPVDEFKKPLFTIGWVLTPDRNDPLVRDVMRLGYAASSTDLFGDEPPVRLPTIEEYPGRALGDFVVDVDDEGAAEEAEVEADAEALDEADTDPGEWDLPDVEVVDEKPAEKPPKPGKSFTISATSKSEFAGKSVDDLIMDRDGCAHLAKMALAMDGERRELCLSWLSFGLGRPVTLESLQAAEAPA